MQPKPQALVYCRVSSVKQLTDGNGIISQEHRCKEYAQQNKYPFRAAFHEEGVSGGSSDRPAFDALLALIDREPDQKFVVIVDDPKRLARSVELHIIYKKELLQRGVPLLSPNFNFSNSEDDPEGMFVEQIIAATGELERSQIRRQTRQKMLARLKSGFWCFSAPTGYRYEKHPNGGRWLVPDTNADILAKALRDYSLGALKDPIHVSRFLEKSGVLGKQIKGYSASVPRILNNPLYAGYYSYEKWKVGWTKAKHEPIIDLITYQRIQERLGNRDRWGAGKAPVLHHDMPFRRIIHCRKCGTPFTGSYSKGKLGKRYGYYFCQGKGACSPATYVAKEDLEASFLNLLDGITPEKDLVKTFQVGSRRVLENQESWASQQIEKQEKQIDAIEDEIQGLVQKCFNFSTPEVLQGFEKQIEKLKQEKTLLLENIENPKIGVDEGLLENVINFIGTPRNFFENADTTRVLTLYKLIFQEPLEYCPKRGYGTPRLGRLFRLNRSFCNDDSRLVPFLMSNWEIWKAHLGN
ncbi:MAG TPA: hypothetical protein DCP28_35050 [Cytophagales bacterium]|nr:hypothetical protein [Cytophagales bacterium]